MKNTLDLPFKTPKVVNAGDKDSCSARSFSNLMFQGKTKDAIRLLLNCESSGGSY